MAASLRSEAKAGTLPHEEGEPALELFYVGVVTELDRRALDAAGIPYRHVPSGKIRRYLSGAHWTVLDLLVRLPLGILRALSELFVLMPDVVFSKGGYGSVPTVFAAWLYRIPVLLHESDLAPGLANLRLARFASSIAVGFRAAERLFPQRKVFVSGIPLRESFLHLPDPAEARKRLGLHDRLPVLFVTGGSQGAQRLNKVLLAILPRLVARAQIIHQVGDKNFPAIEEFIEKDLRHLPGVEGYRAVGTLAEEDMAAAFAAADLVVSRAGGTVLAEIAAAGKPSLLVPLHEAAQQHQWENAYFFREQGSAVVLDETNMSSAIFEATILRLLENPQDLRLMAERVRTLARMGAADDLAEVLSAMAQGRVPQRRVAEASP